MSPGLGSSTTLRELHLRGCPLQSDGIVALFKILPRTLTHIDISGTDAGPEGFVAAAAAVAEQQNSRGSLSLRRLVACGCRGDDASLAALVDSLAKQGWCCSSHGIDIDYSGNVAGKLTIAALARCPHLRAVCLHDCKLGLDGGDALSSEISSQGDTTNTNEGKFSSLHELDISANALETPQLINILDALRSTAGTCCPELRQLVIAANPGAMEDAVTQAVERLQEARTGLDVVRRSADTGERNGQN
jgi:hypothetical protein